MRVQTDVVLLKFRQNFGSWVAYLKSLNTSTGVWLRVQELDGLSMESLASLKVGDGEHFDKVWLSLRNPILIMRCASLGVEQ
jgi:hypothetical protein